MAATFVFYVTWGLGRQHLRPVRHLSAGHRQRCLAESGHRDQPGLPPDRAAADLRFVRVADSPWRDRLFYVAAVVQIVAFCIASLTAGALVGMLVFFVLYQLSNPFAGEANYKVWSQLTLPADTRGTTQGLTYALSRGVFAVAAFFTPALLDHSPAVLLWSITACMAAAGVRGRVHRPRPHAAFP